MIQHALDLQEEKDKESVALYGYIFGDDQHTQNVKDPHLTTSLG
jgi:hypothetical protein